MASWLRMRLWATWFTNLSIVNRFMNWIILMYIILFEDWRRETETEGAKEEGPTEVVRQETQPGRYAEGCCQAEQWVRTKGKLCGLKQVKFKWECKWFCYLRVFEVKIKCFVVCEVLWLQFWKQLSVVGISTCIHFIQSIMIVCNVLRILY